MGQVTHALLTRPPLTLESLGFIQSPFDLHVLSTPPAFILSQDQTLMFKSSLQSKTAGLPSAIPFLTVLRSLLSKLFVCDSLNRLEFILLESFKVVSLFSYQGSVAVYQTQLIKNIITCYVCQLLFKTVFDSLCYS